MSELFLLSGTAEPPPEIMPALGLLLHTVRTGPADMIALDDAAGADAILVDARKDLISARRLCRLLRGAGAETPILAIMTEGGLAAVTADWGTDDVVLCTAGPAEVEARLRLAIGRQAAAAPTAPDEIWSGDLSIDEATYTARLRARVLDLTFKEFELLKFLAQHPGRVFTRAQLLQEVWGYDYFGGTRTVDVHVRRLRAKLGPEHEALIGTVRNVGYRFVPLKQSEDGRRGHLREARPSARPPAGEAEGEGDGAGTRADSGGREAHGGGADTHGGGADAGGGGADAHGEAGRAATRRMSPARAGR
jgi:DNA-binding response OmpR family regulator